MSGRLDGILASEDLEDAWSFSRAEEFWELYRPYTPYGKDERDERRVYSDPVAIEVLLDRTEAATAWLDSTRDDPAARDRAGYYLKRMPRLPSSVKAEYELAEIFQVKKFLADYQGLRTALDERTCTVFGLGPAAPGLAAELAKGGSDPETFFVSDAYDPSLAEVRAAIVRTDADLETARNAAETRLAARHGVRLSGRDFALVPRTQAEALLTDRDLAVVEPYDDRLYLVRPAADARILGLRDRRDELAARERILEDGVLRRLSALIAEALPEIRTASERIRDFDLALARARLVRELGLVRPNLSSDGLWELSHGRFLPCEEECGRLGLSYTPLSARFEEPVTTIFGSNMGGKTVALKTVLFFQILAQAGFHVPAAAFRSRVYARLSYVGELAGERLAGLSGFGFEIHRFIRAWEGMGEGGCLAVFDEFARTTSSREAEALLSAAQTALAARPGVKSFFATHFRGLVRSPGVDYLRMRGLDRASASECLEADAPRAERLARINRHMRYELEPDTEGPGPSDALTVAALLGLPGEIVRKAEAIIRTQDSGGR